MIDLGILAFVFLYAVLGYFTGLIRRVVGFAAVYLGFLAATQAAPTMANVILGSFSNWAVPDAITVAYFGLLVLVPLVIEVMAAFVHGRIQVAAIIYDRPTGALVGLLTGVLVAATAVYLLLGGAQPPEGSPDGNQIATVDAIKHSAVAPPLVEGLGRPAVILFSPVLPQDPPTYFNGQGVRPK